MLALRLALLASAFFILPLKVGAIQVQDSSYYNAGPNTFVCASTSTLPASNGAGLGTSTTGFILVNPQGSTAKLVVLDVGVSFTASPAAAAAVMLVYNNVPAGAVTSGIAGYLTSALVGSSTGTLTGTITGSQATCYASGILPAAPTFFRAIGGTTGASAIGGVSIVDHPYPPGSVVVPPGGILSIATSSAASFITHVTWIEVRL